MLASTAGLILLEIIMEIYSDIEIKLSRKKVKIIDNPYNMDEEEDELKK